MAQGNIVKVKIEIMWETQHVTLSVKRCRIEKQITYALVRRRV